MACEECSFARTSYSIRKRGSLTEFFRVHLFLTLDRTSASSLDLAALQSAELASLTSVVGLRMQ